MQIELEKIFEVSPEVNEKMARLIIKALSENIEDGMDYIRFKQSVQNLLGMNMDEATSIKSAYSTASTMGMTKEKLIKSISTYQLVVDKERDKFIETLKNQIQNQITNPGATLKEIDDSIAANERKIAQLKQENELYLQKKDQIKADIEVSEEKIEKTRAEFLSVYESFSKNLEADKSHFSSML
ncbi:MAG: hypothetical protein RLZZ546_1983 [Bacteroidota bacterium]|jgi:hypothetical protein